MTQAATPHRPDRFRPAASSHGILGAMSPDGTVPCLPDDGWQRRTLADLAGLAARDARITGLVAHGSASETGGLIDRWSDLDLLITTSDPIAVAEDFSGQIEAHLSAVFAASRGGDAARYTVRLVLRDLRRIDITASPEPGKPPAASATEQQPDDAAARLIGDFQFDAVLAAVKTARGDVLIGAHLTLQLARHVLVIAMLLRDRDAGTDHHRHGGSRWDHWATRLAAAPAPFDKAGITAAIRFYITTLDEILACWDHGMRADNGPLLGLLRAVEIFSGG